jgi:hypothetical protein
VTAFFRERPAVFCFLALAVLFWLTNREAFHGYFSGDDLATLTYAPSGNTVEWLKLLATPALNTSNFRPVGAFYYKWLGTTYWLRFRAYVIALQWLHLINVALLLVWLRRLRLPLFASVASCCWFTLCSILMPAFWQPMYVYDVACCLFCLITLLLYDSGYWILGLLTLWIAYRAKEVAVMLPAALALYEFLLAERRFKRLIPYLLISLSFGVQALLFHQPEGTYALHFAPGSIFQTVAFYAAALLAGPAITMLILAVPQVVHDRRFWWGISTAGCLLVPMLALPGRLFAVYWYVPAIGLTVAIAALAAQAPRWTLAIGLAVWMVLNYVQVREHGQALLQLEWEAKKYAQDVQAFARRNPDRNLILYDGTPEGIKSWGLESLAQIDWRRGLAVRAVTANDTSLEPGTALFRWHPDEHRLEIVSK